jgi:hypothetical protein
MTSTAHRLVGLAATIAAARRYPEKVLPALELVTRDRPWLFPLIEAAVAGDAQALQQLKAWVERDEQVLH